MKLQLVLATLFIGGCVTVDVGASKSEPAKNVDYQAPSFPYEKSSSVTSDKLWISSATGNSISYMSECAASPEPTLGQLEHEALSSLSDLEILQSEKVQYNHREALKTTAQGKLDGVKIKMSLMTLKKNNCNYTIVYVAVGKNYEKEISYFDKFLKEFRAP